MHLSNEDIEWSGQWQWTLLWGTRFTQRKYASWPYVYSCQLPFLVFQLVQEATRSRPKTKFFWGSIHPEPPTLWHTLNAIPSQRDLPPYSPGTSIPHTVITCNILAGQACKNGWTWHRRVALVLNFLVAIMCSDSDSDSEMFFRQDCYISYMLYSDVILTNCHPISLAF